jgi:hypothetical protein
MGERVRGENLNAEIWCKSICFKLLGLSLTPNLGCVNPLHKRMRNEGLDETIPSTNP